MARPLVSVGDANVSKAVALAHLDRVAEVRTPSDDPERELVGLALLESLEDESLPEGDR